MGENYRTFCGVAGVKEDCVRVRYVWIVLDCCHGVLKYYYDYVRVR